MFSDVTRSNGRWLRKNVVVCHLLISTHARSHTQLKHLLTLGGNKISLWSLPLYLVYELKTECFNLSHVGSLELTACTRKGGFNNLLPMGLVFCRL